MDGMRWSCPHCGTQLALSEDKIGTGWSFARCYRCGGFALIRRSELSVIRVDKAPAGEAVLLPEATEDPRRALSAQAAQNLAAATPPPAPVIRPAPLRNNSNPTAIQVAPPAALPPEPALKASARLPDPLPEIVIPQALLEKPKRRFGTPLLYTGIGFASLATIASGTYLITEGRSLLRQAAQAAHEEESAPARPVAAAATAPAEDVIPAAPALGGNVASAHDVITDEVHHLAMAPSRVPAADGLAVRASRPGIHLYTGPGMQFPVIGTADPAIAYPVKGWSDQWFKIELNANTVAWIRNDLVLPPRSSCRLTSPRGSPNRRV